jgi:hypothetical protein
VGHRRARDDPRHDRARQRPQVAEELRQFVDDRIDVVVELADEVGADVSSRWPMRWAANAAW